MSAVAEPWVLLTIAAALFQSVRTAAQKQLNTELSVLAGTYVRALLGLPVMIAYLAVVKSVNGAPWPSVNAAFFGHCLVTALTQLAATAALLSLFRLRNFAVANQLGKSDMIFTALIGSVLFAQPLSAVSWLALALTGAGVATIMTARLPGSALPSTCWRRAFNDPSVRIGLFVGLMFGICNLTLREATLNLGGSTHVMAGAVTVAAVTAIQVAVMAAWLSRVEPRAHGAVLRVLPLAGFVGFTSAAGSILWFTAFAIETAAHVRIVGQIELVFTVLIASYYFRERIAPMEAAGMALTLAGIVLLQVAG